MSFVDGLVECEFVEFLAARFNLETAARPTKGEWSRLGNTIGALALRLSLLTDAQVHELLQVQDEQGGFFGELAIRAGYLSAEQVDGILKIQQMHDQLQLGEQLVASGRLDVPELLTCMAEFLSRRGDFGE